MTNWILGDKFYAVYPHKNSIKGLWESKWKMAVRNEELPCCQAMYAYLPYQTI